VGLRGVIRQCRKPPVGSGRFIVWTMNRSHAGLTSWGLQHIQIGQRYTILDIGCGGGRTVHTLASLATSESARRGLREASVASSRGLNRVAGRFRHVEIRRASVSHVAVPNDQFDLVTAVKHTTIGPIVGGHARDLPLSSSGASVLIIGRPTAGAGSTCRTYLR